jgi:hypothetical protein
MPPKKPKAHSISSEQAKYAADYLAQLSKKTPAEITAEAKRIAARDNIQVKSARRRLERYTAGSERVLKTGKKSVAGQRRELAKSRKLPDIIKPIPVREFSPTTFELKATFDFYGNDKRHRPIKFPLTAAETKQVLESKTKAEAAATLASFPRFSFLESATISKIDYLDVID